MMRRATVGVLGGLAAGLVLTGCAAGAAADDPGRPVPSSAESSAGSSTAGTGPGARASEPAAPVDVPPGLETIPLSAALDHVHGLHVRADGVLVAGTHTGVVEIGPTGAITSLGSDPHDLMGMTGVPGSDTLVSSGHPGAGTGLPNPLGLIVSADGGATWSPRALLGQVDFHALAADGETVVGFDGREGLLVSADAGETFRRGAAVAPAALALTPGGIWATTAQGLQLSTDGGRTFAVVDGAPLLVLLASGADGSLWGVDVDGVAWRSTDGRGWDRRATVGAVEAIAVGPGAVAYALTSTSLAELT